MENSLKLQMDVKNNAEDLRRYMLDLQSWEEEMKQKESELKNIANKVADIPPPRNKIKRIIKDGQDDKKTVSNDEKKLKKIHAYDYSAWDKYDVDKACAELDEEQEEKTEGTQLCTQENEDKEDKTIEKGKEIEEEAVGSNSNLKHLDEAFYEKKLGNLFVRKEKWEDAIKCYTKAIELDSRNAIYYANRALCFIKLKNFRSAEVDATVAIQLDNSYVKAYQRRAFARLALGQTEEALSDYKEVVKLEPKNTQANAEIIKIEKKLKTDVSNSKEEKTKKKIFDPRTIFKTETKKKSSVKWDEDEAKKKEVEVKKEEPVKSVALKDSKESFDSNDVEKKVEDMKKEKSSEVLEKDDVFGKTPDGFTVVKPIKVPPHLRPKKPFRRVPVKDVTSEAETFNEIVSIFNSKLSRNEVTEKKPENNSFSSAKDETSDTCEIKSFQNPETFFQFQHVWKTVKNNPQRAISYLEKITPEHLFEILKHNLESDLFSELISILSMCAHKNSELVYTILNKFSQVDRLGSLLLFLSESDKKNLIECICNLDTRTDWEIQNLRQVYHLTDVV